MNTLTAKIFRVVLSYTRPLYFSGLSGTILKAHEEVCDFPGSGYCLKWRAVHNMAKNFQIS
jgi:hypothetical protein